jgi:hypothetical protein
MPNTMKAAIAAVLTAAWAASPQLASATIYTDVPGLYEEQVFQLCTGGSPCIFSFSPLSRAVTVTKLSCNFFFNPIVANLLNVTFGQANQQGDLTAVGEFIAPINLMAFATSFSQWQFLVNTLHPFKKGDIPAVGFGFEDNPDGTTTTARCTITGTVN